MASQPALVVEEEDEAIVEEWQPKAGARPSTVAGSTPQVNAVDDPESVLRALEQTLIGEVSTMMTAAPLMTPVKRLPVRVLLPPSLSSPSPPCDVLSADRNTARFRQVQGAGASITTNATSLLGWQAECAVGTGDVPRKVLPSALPRAQHALPQLSSESSFP
jgi:hypothetical protein